MKNAKQLLILSIVILSIVLLYGCGSNINRTYTCASCWDEVEELVNCPWCDAKVCESCANYVYENVDLVDFVYDIDRGDRYYVFHSDEFYQEAWEDIFIPDADYDLEEFNEFLSEYGYKLEKIN